MSTGNGSSGLEKIEHRIDERRRRIADLSDELAARLDPADMSARATQALVHHGRRTAENALNQAARKAPLALLGVGIATTLFGLSVDRATAVQNSSTPRIPQPTPRLDASSPAEERWLVPASLLVVASLAMAIRARRPNDSRDKIGPV